MPLVKKINPNWVPSENKGLQVGDIIDMPNSQALVDSGMAVYVDKDGNELKRIGKSPCPICTFSTDDPYALADHILNKHPRKSQFAAGNLVKASVLEKAKIEEILVAKEFKDMTPEEKKQWRIDNLKKAREAKAQKEIVKA